MKLNETKIASADLSMPVLLFLNGSACHFAHFLKSINDDSIQYEKLS
ncbi:hypothetical protein [Photorhabdus bodei]|nr:hypothetical protein [Photorhabdus bodei]MCC8464771.1 hypothetical protein [Photorhabdus bodei]